MTCPGITHHAGCDCHEERHAAELVSLRAALAAMTERAAGLERERDATYALLDKATTLLDDLQGIEPGNERAIDEAQQRASDWLDTVIVDRKLPQPSELLSALPAVESGGGSKESK